MVDPDELVDAPPSEAEATRAEELRAALESGSSSSGADLLRALALGNEPRPLAPGENDRLVARALMTKRRRSRFAVIRGPFRGYAALALAAALLLFFIVRGRHEVSPIREAPLARVRSTQPLFYRPFDRTENASARVDRIAMAREKDLRDNHFASWGVR